MNDMATLANPEPASMEAREFDMEILIGYVLLGGVLISVGLIGFGVLWRWVSTGQLGMDYTIAGTNLFGFVVEDLQLLAQGALRPRLFVSLGIAALMLTPFVRVLASLLFFAFAEHNWKYTAFTAFVFSVLTYSLFLR